MNKTDWVLGKEVRNFLEKNGVETPFSGTMLNKQEQIKLIEEKFFDIMSAMGLDMTDDSLIDTPKRVAKMFINEIFIGLDYDNFPKCTTVENKMRYNEMITVKDIGVMSSCEHHFVTIDGKAKVSYIPKDKVLGLSKINRIVDFFSRRPQIQERLTEQIYYALSYILDTEDVAVSIDAVHYCVKSRGVGDASSSTKTTKLGGAFKKSKVRQEFLNE